MAHIDLNNIYDRQAFNRFIQDDFLPEDFFSTDEDVDLNFNTRQIKKVVKLGECPSLDLKLYEIKWESSADPRVTLTKETFRLMKEYSDYNVLAIYSSPNTDNYRFSFVTIGVKP